jgi:hypothetical protein
LNAYYFNGVKKTTNHIKKKNWRFRNTLTKQLKLIKSPIEEHHVQSCNLYRSFTEISNVVLQWPWKHDSWLQSRI